LLVRGPTLDYVRQFVGTNMLNRGEPGGTRVYAHANHRLDLPDEAKEHEVALELRRGETIRGSVVNPDGTTPEEVLLLWIGNSSLLQGRFDAPRQWVRGGKFELAGVDPGAEDVRVFFLDPKNKLGALVHLDGKRADEPLTVTLQPTGTAVVRLVNEQGQPIANEDYSYGPHMVVTPGPSPMLAYGRELEGAFADEFILANWDRENHWDLKTDANGVVRLEGLIPGATYRILGGADGIFEVLHEFTVESGQTIDLGTLQAGEGGSLSVAPNPKSTSDALGAGLPTPPKRSIEGLPAASPSDSKAEADGLITIRGRVFDPAGEVRDSD
jgi:hypothetical protein